MECSTVVKVLQMQEVNGDQQAAVSLQSKKAEKEKEASSTRTTPSYGERRSVPAGRSSPSQPADGRQNEAFLVMSDEIVWTSQCSHWHGMQAGISSLSLYPSTPAPDRRWGTSNHGLSTTFEVHTVRTTMRIHLFASAVACISPCDSLCILFWTQSTSLSFLLSLLTDPSVD
jgi:hypothetical protein